MAIAQKGAFTQNFRLVGGGSLSQAITYTSGAEVLILQIYDQNNSCANLSSEAFSTGTIVKKVCTAGLDNGSLSVYYIVSPTGTSGTFTATSAGASDVYIHSGAYSGNDLTNPIYATELAATTGTGHTWSPTSVPTGSVAMVQDLVFPGTNNSSAGTNLAFITGSYLAADTQSMMDSTGNNIAGSPTISTIPEGLGFGHFIGVIIQPPQAAAVNSGFFFAAAS